MKSKILYLYSAVLLLAVLPLQAQDQSGGEARTVNRNITYLPILFYTPETKIAGGGLVNYNFYASHDNGTAFPSTIMPTVIYTQNRQLISELYGDLYLSGGYHLQGRLGYKDFPDKFYGTGSRTDDGVVEDYTEQSVEAMILAQKRLFYKIDFGVWYTFAYRKITESEPGGQLERMEIPGSESGYTSGAGLVITRDTRDNKFFPTGGAFQELAWVYYGNETGSDYLFSQYKIDVKKYFSPAENQALAFRAMAGFTAGNPPFQNMSAFGGPNILRGYYAGRYRDRQMTVYQAEYRFPLFGRLGAAFFADLGHIAHELHDFKLNDYKYSLGSGLRYRINKNEKLNIRLDLGMTKEGSGLYITLGEAF
ncbi:MAG: BamA/TamA family outer membrane protein [Calditrichaceae bacterium]